MALHILRTTNSQYVGTLYSIFLEPNVPFTFTRDADSIEFKAIKIPLCYSNYLSKLSLQITCNQFIIFEINLKLLKLLQNNDSNMLLFPPSLIFKTIENEIPLVGIQFQQINVNIKSTLEFDNLDKIELLLINKYYESNLRRKMIFPFSKPVHYFQTIKFKSSEVIFKPKTFLLGFFIRTTFIENIKFQIENQELFDYDSDKIELVGEIINKQINWTKEHSKTIHNLPLPTELINIIEQKCAKSDKYLYWIPISASFIKERWYSFNINTFCKGNCKIIFNKEHTGSIHLLNFNYFIKDSGLCGLKYM